MADLLKSKGTRSHGAGPWRARTSKRTAWQLAAGVVLAWALSRLLQLPGGWWAVMSTLIVIRPGTGSTLDAGWDRVRGAALGAVMALLGVSLQALGVDTVAGTLAVVGTLAFASAWAPGLRSAPITALIVMQASATADQSVWHVALLRIAEIGVGILAGVLVTLPGSGHHARKRFEAACAELLRLWADAFAATPSATADGQLAIDDRRWRTALVGLGALARSADQPGLGLRRGQRKASAMASCEGAARLLARALNDLSALRRLIALLPNEATTQVSSALQGPVVVALRSTSDTLKGQGQADLTALRGFASMRPTVPGGQSAAPDPAQWVAPGVALLVQDLVALARWRAEPAASDR